MWICSPHPLWVLATATVLSDSVAFDRVNNVSLLAYGLLILLHLQTEEKKAVHRSAENASSPRRPILGKNPFSLTSVLYLPRRHRTAGTVLLQRRYLSGWWGEWRPV